MIGRDSPDLRDSRGRLFLVAVLALYAAGVANALRAGVASSLKADIFDKADPAHAAALIGSALGASFAGWSLAVLVASPFLDTIGMRRALVAAATLLVAGAALVVGGDRLGDGSQVGDLIWLGMGLQGLAWGLIEATINPLISALYPGERTRRLNLLHAWWPAGLITGGLLGVAFGAAEIDWRILFGLVAIPALLFGVLASSAVFPPTERVARGIPFGEMFKELLRQPGIFLWLAIMMMTSACELAPGQWVDLALSETVGMRGILLLVYVSGIAFVFRHFAGPLERRLSNVGLLCVTSVLATGGLYGLGIANSPVTALFAGTAWGVGVCFMWPTMLAIVSERYPRGGSLFIGLVGAAGAASNYLVLPRLGALYDRARLEALGRQEASQADPAALHAAAVQAATVSFQAIAIIPAVLTLVFGLIWLWERVGRKRAAVATVVQ